MSDGAFNVQGLIVVFGTRRTDGVASYGVFHMTTKTTPAKSTMKQAEVAHPGMMGDGTEEQNLGQHGNPAARIPEKEVAAAFGNERPAKKPSAR